MYPFKGRVLSSDQHTQSGSHSQMRTEDTSVTLERSWWPSQPGSSLTPTPATLDLFSAPCPTRGILLSVAPTAFRESLFNQPRG